MKKISKTKQKLGEKSKVKKKKNLQKSPIF